MLLGEARSKVHHLAGVPLRPATAREAFPTEDLIRALNKLILSDLPLDEHVTPGHYTTAQVGGGRFRPPSPQHVPLLMRELVAWLGGSAWDPVLPFGLALPLLKAIVSHLYLAWIHPFGDGNGRTARAIEFGLLIQAGVPSVAAHLLSNHFNETRSEYYRQLDHASASGGDIVPFIRYALSGFVDGLSDQIKRVRVDQKDIVWRNVVHETLKGEKGQVATRRRELALSLPKRTKAVRSHDVLDLNPRLGRMYQGLTAKAVSRDLHFLEEKGLATREQQRWYANRAIVTGLMPLMQLGDIFFNAPDGHARTEEDDDDAAAKS